MIIFRSCETLIEQKLSLTTIILSEANRFRNKH